MKIKNLKDGSAFRLSERAGAATYILQRIDSKTAIYTSETSGKTFKKPANIVCYPAKKKGI